jgi:hypothetical protein
MGERSGIGVVELVILEVLDSLGAQADQSEVPNTWVLAEVDKRIGLAPGYAYQVLVDLARPWKMPVQLVSGQGDYGNFWDDQPASHFRHTESRLSRAGEVVVAAERGKLAPVPVGLINGNTYRDGTRPPFRPERVIEAGRQVIRRPQVTDAELVETAGTPDFLTGCTVTGDLAALAAGRPADLRLQAQARVIGDLSALGPDRPALLGPPAGDQASVLVEHMPPNASRPVVMTAIAEMARQWARHADAARNGLLPVRDIVDISHYDDRFVCFPELGTTAELLRDLLLDFHGITTTMPVELPQPLPTLIRRWVLAYQDQDLLTSLARLGSAIRD